MGMVGLPYQIAVILPHLRIGGVLNCAPQEQGKPTTGDVVNLPCVCTATAKLSGVL